MDKKLLIIFSMLFCFGFANGATITSTGTGNWSSASSWVGNVVPGPDDDVIIASGSTITINSNVSAKSITINGTLLVSGDRTVTTSAGNTLAIIINGTLGFSSNQSDIRFPEGTTLFINKPSGKIDESGGCSNNVALYIGSLKFAVCVGSGNGNNATYTFEQLNELGGTIQSNPTSDAPICEGNTLNFTAAKIGVDGTGLKWDWSIKPPGTASFEPYLNSQNVVSFANAVAGIYEANLTYTTTYGGVSYTSSKTIFATVNAKPVASITASGPTTFCDGGSVTLTSSAGSSYAWSNGQTTQSIVVTSSDDYSVIVKNALGCESLESAPITVTMRPILAVPSVFSNIGATCVSSTGTVVLRNLPTTTTAIPNWVIHQTGTVLQTYTGGGGADPTTYTISNLIPGTYNFSIEFGDYCPVSINGVVVKTAETNIWRGPGSGPTFGWSKGSDPSSDGTESIEFAADYQSTGDLASCSCKVNAGKLVTINAGHTLYVENQLVVESAAGAKLTFENNASLVQLNNVANTGNIIYKRNTTPVRRYDFTCWSSPVTRTPAFMLKDLSPDTLGDKYYKYNPTTGWIIIYNGAAEMVKGVGYIIRAPQYWDIYQPLVYSGSFTGVPNNGPVTVPLIAAERSSLLGNPYPSAIYADYFIRDNQNNVYGTLYFWTHNTPPAKVLPGDKTYQYTTDDYAIYNLTGSVDVGHLSSAGATTSPNQDPPSGYIAAGQSFFAKSKTNLSAVFTNSMRVRGSNAQFFKSVATQKENTESHKVWLNLSNAEGAFKQLLVGYLEGATNSWDDNYDGLTINGNKYVDFYSINTDQKLIVQGRALPFEETDIVPLGYKSTIAGEFVISIDHASGDLDTHPIYLEDKANNMLHDLRSSDYKFTTTIGTFNDRFVLRYVGETLGNEEFQDSEQAVLVSTKDKVIKVTSTKEIINVITIFDLTGKVIYSKDKIDSTELQIANIQSGSQVLLIKVSLENDVASTIKIVF
ncbi:T9SS sorting signal type C domain-containing protein [Flavobacterium saccharophilum]|uniref:G8 domain-containing protein n=1 Tax=Flavobacterium saccharophilum TaxID=29534 RepID=A0A1M6ZGU9_9FLAO|nr:T9SS sorting signal type C domain-containing protein [Flavobacterium saccharophilum]SHL29726.1 G8 domain-containing protein [Flavobacterium saccharophilum]